jgi:dCMP deaminase
MARIIVPPWDDYFMTMVYLAAMRSKDNKTHIGAVIVGPNNEVRSTGYNSFVRGLNDKVLARQEAPEKYFWFEHAERNAIYNATLMGISLKGCRMYTNGIPCADCARGIIQTGINEVIVDYEWNKGNSKKWADSTKRALAMFNETKVEVRYWKGKFVKPQKFRRGVWQDL